MADKVTTTKILGVGLEYTKQDDGTKKTVYLKLPNPTSNLTESLIKEKVSTLITGTEPIFKTPDYHDFDSDTAITTAYTEQVQTVEFDIGIVS